MSKPTSGPWEYTGTKVKTNARIRRERTFGYGCGNDFVCSLDDGEYHNYCNQQEQDANGNLIAAAPDLLEACEAIALAKDCQEVATVLPLVEAAIAKAKGLTSE